VAAVAPASTATEDAGGAARPNRAAGLPPRARVYIAAVALAAAATLFPLLARLSPDARDLLVFALLTAGATLGSFLIVSTEPNHGFNTALVFITAAVLLLPPGLVALIAVVHVVPEIVRRDFPWYSQVFNAANYLLDALAGWLAFDALSGHGPLAGDGRVALAAATACVVIVGSNHALLAGALRLARSRSLRETGLFSWKSLSTELMLASLGATLAVVWHENVYLAPLVLAPFVLINRSFSLLELLRSSEQRFRAIYESTAMGIRLTDTRGRVIDANSAFAEMVGVAPEDLLGRTVAEVVHEEDVERHGELFRALVEGRQERLALEQRYVRTDGAVGWAHVTESLVHDADGHPAFTIGMVHDVTDRKLLEERLNQTQKMEAVGRLAGGVAHDFNNLLTVITAHSRFLLGSLDAGEPIGRGDVEAIGKAADKAAALTNQLLAFGRRQFRQPRVLDLNASVLEMYTLLDRTMGEEVRIGLELEASLKHVQADSAQIEQVLVNLALNAADAMPDGGELTIRTATVPAPAGVDAPLATSYVLLAVGDTGCGMDAETKARMFEPFFTTKQAKGTGLGLASVYGIVAQSGGFVEVESEPGAGTTISVYLPAAAEGANRGDEVVALPARAQQRRTILLVDDEDLVRTAARRILAGNGYAVLEAFDALEALEVARGQTIDLLVTDLVMPRMHGRELADTLLAAQPGMGVVYVSGYTDDTLESRPTAGGEVRLVQKPFTQETLLGAVAEALREADTERRPLGASAGR
jgi:PAS domain S-box-containing protein